MIEAIGRVMLYVMNPRAVADFWIEKIGFIEIGEQPGPDNTVSVEIAPKAGADTTFVLFSREVIAKYEPDLTLGVPSILLSSSDLDADFAAFTAKGVTMGKLIEMQGMRTFNFADIEGNYFAVREMI